MLNESPKDQKQQNELKKSKSDAEHHEQSDVKNHNEHSPEKPAQPKPTNSSEATPLSTTTLHAQEKTHNRWTTIMTAAIGVVALCIAIGLGKLSELNAHEKKHTVQSFAVCAHKLLHGNLSFAESLEYHIEHGITCFDIDVVPLATPFGAAVVGHPDDIAAAMNLPQYTNALVGADIRDIQLMYKRNKKYPLLDDAVELFEKYKASISLVTFEPKLTFANDSSRIRNLAGRMKSIAGFSAIVTREHSVAAALQQYSSHIPAALSVRDADLFDQNHFCQVDDDIRKHEIRFYSRILSSVKALKWCEELRGASFWADLKLPISAWTIDTKADFDAVMHVSKLEYVISNQPYNILMMRKDVQTG